MSALLLLGGIIYGLLSGSWGMGAIAFGLGAVVLGLDRLHVAQSRPERAIGWVLALCGALTMMFIAIRMALGVTEGCYLNGTQGASENALARQPDFREA